MTGEERAALASRLYDVPVELVQFGMGRENDVTLIEFLKQRLDEEELLAREAEGADLFDGTGIIVMHLHGGDTRSITLPSHVARFAARHDPARVLVEVEAKRQIIAKIEETQRRADANAAIEYFLYDMVEVGQMLALPYADHPDYDQSWKPE